MSSKSEISCGSVKPQFSIHQPQPSPPSTASEKQTLRPSKSRLDLSRMKTSLGSIMESDTSSPDKSTPYSLRRSREHDSVTSYLNSRRGNRLGVDTTYLKKFVQEHEEEKMKRFKKPGEAADLFRKISRRAVICLMWVKCIFKQRDNYLERQLEEFNDQTKEMEGALFVKQMEVAGTVFNVQEYMPNREIVLKKEVQDILTRPPYSRSRADIVVVLNAMQTVKAFTEYPLHVQEKLCQVAWYQRIPPKKVIIRQGHRGFNFYFVISGKGIIKVVRRRADGTIMNGEKVVFRVERGSSFGDIALLHNVERTATVESVTEMSLLVIERDDFVRIFMQRSSSEGIKSDHVEFLKTVSALKHWPVDRILNARDNCIFHYFKRGKLIVADSRTSDYLYIVKVGTCEVLKQLKAVKAETLSDKEKQLRRDEDLKSVYAPSNGHRAVSTIPSTHKLPLIINKVLDVNPEEELKQSMQTFIDARKTDPNVMVDLPRILQPDIDEYQRETSFIHPSERTHMADIVAHVLRSQKVKENASKRPAKTSGEKESSNNLKVRKPERKISVVNTDDEEYRMERRRRMVTRQNSLAPFNLVVSASGEEKSPEGGGEGFSKSKIQQLTRRWKLKAATASDDTFKELSLAREMSESPDKLIQQPMMRRQSYSTCPEVVDGPLMLSHEGKQQKIPDVRSPSRRNQKPVFVRLALLRPKDVFGLDTLDFDANYKATETSVCLVSRGAEVLMIKKAFFLNHCTSENLEHLRTIVAPYPVEARMQDNLQISTDWKLFCTQQLQSALHRQKTKHSLR